MTHKIKRPALTEDAFLDWYRDQLPDLSPIGPEAPLPPLFPGEGAPACDEEVESVDPERLGRPETLYMEELDKVAPLSLAEQDALALRVCAGDRDAGDRLAMSKLKMVLALAQRYLGRGMALIDLVQVGNSALVKAIETIEQRQEPSLSRHTSWWVRKEIVSELRQLHPRLTDEAMKRICDQISIVKAYEALEKELGRAPEIQEVAARVELPLELVQKVVTSRRKPAEPVQDDEEHEGDDPGTNAALLLSLPREMLMDALDTLLPREKKLLALRLGLVDGRIHTPREISEMYNATSSSLYLYEEKLVRMIRDHLYVEELARVLREQAPPEDPV